MPELPLSSITKITVCNSTIAAGTTDITGTAVDMAGWRGVMFIAEFSTLTASQVTSMYAQHDDISTMANAANCAGSSSGAMPDTGSNKAIWIDIFKPAKRYVRPVVDRGTANAVINTVIAIQYGPVWEPTAHDATTVTNGTQVTTPDSGTP